MYEKVKIFFLGFLVSSLLFGACLLSGYFRSQDITRKMLDEIDRAKLENSNLERRLEESARVSNDLAIELARVRAENQRTLEALERSASGAGEIEGINREVASLIEQAIKLLDSSGFD